MICDVVILRLFFDASGWWVGVQVMVGCVGLYGGAGVCVSLWRGAEGEEVLGFRYGNGRFGFV